MYYNLIVYWLSGCIILLKIITCRILNPHSVKNYQTTFKNQLNIYFLNTQPLTNFKTYKFSTKIQENHLTHLRKAIKQMQSATLGPTPAS